ncbi:hypothetical protein SLEP1_g18929 [Rubroshorea leprosula]|uniref:DUF4218 domain-containing protein n=1 Tax=Rubroshorea leprosula TaxID=152421 RepID=A0AAV5IZ59_9ROSI|nr:hypothetical protein SLEP1_g18929 [Rubroshorea leprosula]
MEHLAIHLPYEARVGGSVQFRWMCPFERRMRKLKSTIGNKIHVEASIVEAFILYEISHFCSRYFGDDVETSWNQPPRNYGDIGTNVLGKLSVFCSTGESIGAHSCTRCLTLEEKDAAELYVLLTCKEVDVWVTMSGNLAGSARRRSSSSGSQEQHNFNHPQLFTDSSVAPDIQLMIDPLMNYTFAPDHENEGPSSLTGKWVKLTDDKLQFADPNIPRAITSLWKSRLMARISHLSWDPADNHHVRDAFLNCMKHRWSDNLRDEKLKWDKNSAYVPCWIPTHIWPQLLTYWDSDESKRLSARGAKNRSSGEMVTHTTGSVSFGIHEMRMDTYVAAECTDSHGSDASSWPRMDNEAWVKAVRGCSSNFMPGIGSQVNPEMVGFTYRKRQPQENLIAALMASDYEETQAKDHEELERQCQQIALMQQQLANMTAAQNNMSQTIAQSVAAALAAHGISPQADSEIKGSDVIKG